MIALVDSWNATFRGSAAKVLLMTVSTYLDKRRDVYARYTSMVNSSGTGKSRMVDEVATKIVTIPMCLREEGSIGSSFLPSSIFSHRHLGQDSLLRTRYYGTG